MPSSSSLRPGSPGREGNEIAMSGDATDETAPSRWFSGGGSARASERRDHHHHCRCPAGCGRAEEGNTCLPCGCRVESLTGRVGLDFYLLGLKYWREKGRCGGSDVYAICWRRCDEGWVDLDLVVGRAVGLDEAGFVVGFGGHRKNATTTSTSGWGILPDGRAVDLGVECTLARVSEASLSRLRPPSRR